MTFALLHRPARTKHLSWNVSLLGELCTIKLLSVISVCGLPYPLMRAHPPMRSPCLNQPDLSRMIRTWSSASGHCSGTGAKGRGVFQALPSICTLHNVQSPQESWCNRQPLWMRPLGVRGGNSAGGKDRDVAAPIGQHATGWRQPWLLRKFLYRSPWGPRHPSGMGLCGLHARPGISAGCWKDFGAMIG